MKLVEQLRSVMLSVSTNKFRVFLTSLGIIIGTFTIIMVVGIGKASEKAVEDQYKRLSVESITISKVRGPGKGMGTTSSKSLTKQDALKMSEELTHVKSVGISTGTSSDIANGSTSSTVNIQGINEAYADITNLTPISGDLFTDEDGLIRNKVVVLGYNLADLLFDGDINAAVGTKIMVKGSPYTVTGVLERIGGSGGISSGPSGMSSSTSADDMAFIPYDVALKYTTGTGGTRGGGGGMGQVTIIAQANDINSVQPAIEEIKQYIGEITGDSESYTIVDAGSTLASAQETSNTMSALLIAVAAIVMVVSGIGIMNVLMVAVKERTREIGILKSIGAARKVILMEFLFEAIFISLCGGLLGVLLSVFAPWVLSFTDINYLASFEGIVLGLGFSVITGIFFGYYPAAKASKLKPIEALNYD
ncbi:MAG: macrolide export ATP-binding/permease protein MacB [Bacillus sp. (in: firmicutes)]|jgi:putative ABC transport system permease protein|uniref:ABC transporter permease n=1 Tax=Bacillus sp. 1NLA3E TaxID=666686 RepID=UPI000247E4AA|nr:ABC transporter permease [Bacillus sp. 1NLA3E]AGK53226.1 macrolide export ATP-binding/permease protein MacB [Bacillus sp. 1NLA3E]MDF2903349.1 macrolide export ATP-binding/permease protein MacB [Bacillus sp. (in: firmicutes)]